MEQRTTSRRAMLASGAAVTASAWIAPSVLSLDRVAAATGSCGAAPVQLDWSAWAGTYPTSVTAADGTVVTIVASDPFGVADAFYFGQVLSGTTSTLDNPLVMAMTNANNGDYTSITLSFSVPVAPCFTLLDVDRGNNSWEDTMIVDGSLSGTPVVLGSGDIATGSAVSVIGPNTLIGVSSAGNGTTDGNAIITYPSAIDTVEIRHSDNTTWTGFQYIGIHDLSWC